MPLLVLSYDPNAHLERLHQPLCRSGLAVSVTGPGGAPRLTTPTSGLRLNATLDGAPFGVTFHVFTRTGGGAWSVAFTIDSPSGTTDYFLPNVPKGEELYARALDPTSKVCPADSATIAAA